MKLEKPRLIAFIITAVITLITIAFIISNSAISKTQSAEFSNQTFGAMQGVLDWLFGKGVINGDQFRKIAHGIEFAVLGVEICLLYYLSYNFKFSKTIEILGIGLAFCVLDESVQLLSDRGAMVADVLIDFGGICFAYLCFLAVVSVVSAIKKNKTKKEKAL